ncbi:MAG: aldehyde dehydrogenase [Melioribacteraceae bacterium]|nr:MAG: aldehyde dehydrogenase [Melioribacteraceae bacterium]
MAANISEETKIYNPATGEEIGISRVHTKEEVLEIISNAKTAQVSWGNTSLKIRVQTLLKVRDFIVNNADRIASTIAQDNGKTLIDALATEVIAAAMAVNYYCKKSKKFLKPYSTGVGNIMLINKRGKIYRRPYGVTGIISPWNYPFAIPFSEVVMSLLAGNAVVLKTAGETQLTGLILKEAFDNAGLPEYIFNYVTMPGKLAGETFLEGKVDKLFFTGSVGVGKILMRQASYTLTPINLELGGNDAMIVCEDADPYRAAKSALWGGFQNAGQSCGGVERIYVHEKIYDSFMEHLKFNIENLKVGIPDHYDIDMGCLTTQKQVNIVKEHIEEALSRGAEIFVKSSIPACGQNFHPAVVLTNVNHDMLVMKDETFGPVVGVMKFSDYDEAIELANDSYLGLTASVCSRDTSRAKNIAYQIKAGAVMINDHLMSHGLPDTPWGGFKESGIGRSHGKLGFDEMTQPQVIINDILPGVKNNLWWHPFDKKLYDGLGGILKLLYSGKVDEKVGGFAKLLKILPKIFSK